MAIIGILSGVGVVAYNGYTLAAKETATKANQTKIVNNMESEFAKCKLDKDSKIFDTHACSSSSRPSPNTISNFANNKLGLKNPYNNTLPVVQSDICTSGSVSIVEKEVGTYDVAYASVKKQTKYNSLVSSGWSSNYSKTTSTSVSLSCTQSTASAGSFDTYKVPVSGGGSGIVVDRNGNMVPSPITGNNGGSSCSVSSCFTDMTWLKGSGYDPTQHKKVMVIAQGSDGNTASPCANGNCKYNFSDNTFTVINTGKVCTAGTKLDNWSQSCK